MFATLVAVSLVGPAAPPAEKEKELPEAAKKELAKFEGKWKGVKVVVNGEEQPEPPADMLVVFKGRKVLLGDTELFEITALDPSTDPKCLDMKALADMGLTKGTVYEGIYKLDGDDLILTVYLGSGGKRPDKFESAKDSDVVFATLKREK